MAVSGRLRRPAGRAERAAWEAADRAARPARLARLRARFAAAGVDAYFGVRREHMRYLTGVHAGRRRGEGRRQLRPVPRQRRRGRRPGRLALHDPGRPRGARGADLRRLQRPAGRWPELRRVRRGAPDRGRGRIRVRRPPGAGSPRRRRTSSWCPSRAGSRPTARSRSRPSSSASRPPAPWRIGRWRRCCRRSARA